MIFKDYYKILGLETNKVNIDEIKVAYRNAAKRYHPDVNVGDKLAEERIKDINEAYRILSSYSSKKKYDKIWSSNANKRKQKEEREKRSKNSFFENVITMFFGDVVERKSKLKETDKDIVKEKGENVETGIDISLEEAFLGKEKSISLRTIEGKMKTFSFEVPAGIKNGGKIRIIGQGKEGKNGGKNGDLFIRVNIKDMDNLKLKGCDLYTYLYLTPWEAALGIKTYINSIDEKIQVYVPQGTQSGERLKIEKKGYKDGKGSRGDLIAEVKIMVPKALTEEERNQFKILKNISKFNPRVDIKTNNGENC